MKPTCGLFWLVDQATASASRALQITSLAHRIEAAQDHSVRVQE